MTTQYQARLMIHYPSLLAVISIIANHHSQPWATIVDYQPVATRIYYEQAAIVVDTGQSPPTAAYSQWSTTTDYLQIIHMKSALVMISITSNYDHHYEPTATFVEYQPLACMVDH